MTQTVPESAPTPDFPAWPYSCLNFYTHLFRDFGRYAETLGTAADGAKAIRADGDLGLSVFHDLMSAYSDLALAPLNLMMTALQTPSNAGPPDPAPKSVKPSAADD